MSRPIVQVFAGLSIALSLLGTFESGAQAASCMDVVNGKSMLPPRSTSESWGASVNALRQINQKVYGRRAVIEALATAVLAREFVWINGEPGGAKTYLSRLMFQSVLNSIPASDKKIFVLQFHKLISEGKISGFQKFSSMMKEGKYEIETSSSLVGDRFLFLIADEAEKSNPAVLNALLSVLNERKAFLGAKVVDSLLSSGVFTSNKTTGEFIQGFYSDRPSGEALLDRMAIKIHIQNQQLTAKDTIAMYDMVKDPQKMSIELPLMELQALVDQVKIPDSMLTEIVELARAYDEYVTHKADESRKLVRYGEAESEYFPANQFSNRSVRRMIQIFKSAFLARQLMAGTTFENMRMVPQKGDLSLLATSALYIGPSQINLKTFPVTEMENDAIKSHSVMVTSGYGVELHLRAQYSPYDNQLALQNLKGITQMVLRQGSDKKWIVISKTPDFEDYTLNEKTLSDLQPKLEEIFKANNIDLAKPQFEVDASGIDGLIAKGTLKKRTKEELESIKADLVQFAETLNQQFERSPERKALAKQDLIPQRKKKEVREFRRDLLKLPQAERLHKYYDWMSFEIKALKQRFVELDYSIEAHLTGLLAHSHLYVFGPPGGAKTALAEVILKSELVKLNADEVDNFTTKILEQGLAKDKKFLRVVLAQMRSEHPKQFHRFLLQFHKLLPEGVLVGFPKIEKQLNDGIEEIETSTSLASQKFIFAILDEVDKANPQTITALLSILNEREVFAGNQVIKTALRTAILTSNKMPSEFLDSYYEDRSTGEAVMDRAVNKVFVSNKISSQDALVQFLSNLENGISPSWKGFLAVSELQPLVDQVEFTNPAAKEALAVIHAQFLARRIKVEEETRKMHLMDPREFPEYYVSASGSASDRSFIAYLDQFKARFIVHQLMQGIPFNEVRTKVELFDLALFFEGLGYWAPQKIDFHSDSQGTLVFTQDSQVIDRLVESGVVNERVKYHLKEMRNEGRDFVEILNSQIGEFMTQYRSEIAQYPELFPSLFKERKQDDASHP